MITLTILVENRTRVARMLSFRFDNITLKSGMQQFTPPKEGPKTVAHFSIFPQLVLPSMAECCCGPQMRDEYITPRRALVRDEFSNCSFRCFFSMFMHDFRKFDSLYASTFWIEIARFRFWNRTFRKVTLSSPLSFSVNYAM